MFSAESDADVVECPYNKTHRMTRKRLQPHLIKCRAHYPEVELQTCPFNNTHLIPEPEFALHVTGCPDRKLITQYKFDAPEVKKEDDEDRVRHAPVECEENWDDTEYEDYDPRKKLALLKESRKPLGVNVSMRPLLQPGELKRIKKERDSDHEDEFEPKPSVKREISPSDDEEPKYSRRPFTPPPPDMGGWSRGRRGTFRSRSRSRSRSRERCRLSPTPPPPPPAMYTHGRYNQRDYSPPPMRRGRPMPPYKLPSPPAPRRYEREATPPYAHTGYELDDDPYYNGGGSISPPRREDERARSPERRRGYERDYERRYYEDRYAPPLPHYYPPPMYVAPMGGRGAYRGYPYAAGRFGGRSRGRYERDY